MEIIMQKDSKETEEFNEDYKIFKEVSVTDPKHCKSVPAFGARPAFTNIDAYYLIEQATKRFGFYGKGFGLKDINYVYMDIGTTKVGIINAVFFFPDGEFPITNSDKVAYVSSKGKEIIDTEFYKKIETNTLGKALSKIGFGADVYMGKFEDTNYIDEAFSQNAICTPEQQQTLRKGLSYYSVDAGAVNKHFVISTLADLPAIKFEEAQAFIKKLGEDAKAKPTAK